MDPNQPDSQKPSGRIARGVAAAAVTVVALLGAAQPAAAGVNTTFNNGAVTVGLTGGDDVTLKCTSQKLQVNTGVHSDIDCEAIASITVYGDGGENHIDLTQVTAVAFDEANLEGDVELHGGEGHDTLIGSAVGDGLFGGGGNDTINSGPDSLLSDDVVWPGSGSDTAITGSSGHDVLGDVGHSFVLTDAAGGYDSELKTTGTPDIDDLAGFDEVWLTGSGNWDTIDASGYSRSTVRIEGEGGSDTLTGPDTVPEFDYVQISGDGGDDSIFGGDGESILFGGSGEDYVAGEGGYDSIDGGLDHDILDGGASSDTVVSRDLGPTTTVIATTITNAGGSDSLTDIEHVVLSDEEPGGSANTVDAMAWPEGLTAQLGGGADKLTAGNGPTLVWAGDGNDEVIGGGSVDHLLGEGGEDTITGGGGDDKLRGGDGNDTLQSRDNLHETDIDCGDGVDLLVADLDDQGDGCESTDRPIAEQPQNPQPQNPQPQNPQPQTQQPPNHQPENQHQQPPPDTRAPTLRLAKGKLDRRGVFTVKVTCPAEVSCTGTAVLASVKKVGKKKVTFGTGSFTVANGQSGTLKIKLSKASLRVVKRQRKIAAQLTINVRDAAGNAAKATAKTTLMGGSR